MKTKSLNKLRIEAREEFIEFFGVEKKEEIRLGSTVFAVFFLGFALIIAIAVAIDSFAQSKSIEEVVLAGSLILIFLAIATTSIFISFLTRKSLSLVRRMQKEFKLVHDLATMKHFLLRRMNEKRNEKLLDVPFFSQELLRFNLNEKESKSIFPLSSLSVLNNILSFLEKKGLGFKFKREFLNEIIPEESEKYEDFPPIEIIVVGDKELKNEVANIFLEDLNKKNQKEPLSSRFIKGFIPREKEKSIIFRFNNLCSERDYKQKIFLEFLGFYSQNNNNIV